jgi:hypothetical protein
MGIDVVRNDRPCSGGAGWQVRKPRALPRIDECILFVLYVEKPKTDLGKLLFPALSLNGTLVRRMAQ